MKYNLLISLLITTSIAPVGGAQNSRGELSLSDGLAVPTPTLTGQAPTSLQTPALPLPAPEPSPQPPILASQDPGSGSSTPRSSHLLDILPPTLQPATQRLVQARDDAQKRLNDLQARLQELDEQRRYADLSQAFRTRVHALATANAISKKFAAAKGLVESPASSLSDPEMVRWAEAWRNPASNLQQINGIKDIISKASMALEEACYHYALSMQQSDALLCARAAIDAELTRVKAEVSEAVLSIATLSFTERRAVVLRDLDNANAQMSQLKLQKILYKLLLAEARIGVERQAEIASAQTLLDNCRREINVLGAQIVRDQEQLGIITSAESLAAIASSPLAPPMDPALDPNAPGS